MWAPMDQGPVDLDPSGFGRFGIRTPRVWNPMELTSLRESRLGSLMLNDVCLICLFVCLLVVCGLFVCGLFVRQIFEKPKNRWHRFRLQPEASCV